MNCRLSTYLRKNMKLIARKEWYVIPVFVVFTLLISLLMSEMMKDSFLGIDTIVPVKIQVQYDNESDSITKFMDVLKDKDSNVIELSDEKPECIITLSDDMKDISLSNMGTSDYRIKMVKSFMETYLQDSNLFQVSVKQANASGNRAAIKTIVSQCDELVGESRISKNLVEGYRELNAKEYFTITIFGFTSILILYFFLNDFFYEKDNDIIKRSVVATNNVKQYLTGFLTFVFLMLFIENVIYILVVHFSGIGFQGNLLALLLLAVLQSLLQTAVVGVICTILKKREQIFGSMICLLILPALFGDTFVKSSLSSNAVIKGINNVIPSSLISNLYKQFMITNQLGSCRTYLIIMVAMILILFTICYASGKKVLQ